jgi:hypothetical protein
MQIPITLLHWGHFLQAPGCSARPTFASPRVGFGATSRYRRDGAGKATTKKPAIPAIQIKFGFRIDFASIREADMMTVRRTFYATISLLLSSPASPLTIAAAPAKARSIIDEWATVKPPAAPALKPVTVDPKTTALLMLDFMNQNCGKRARCIASIPAMKKLLGEARSARVLSAQHERFPNHPGKRRLIGAPRLDGMREGTDRAACPSDASRTGGFKLGFGSVAACFAGARSTTRVCKLFHSRATILAGLSRPRLVPNVRVTRGLAEGA